MSPLVRNFILFQAGWLICVIAGSGQWHWAGTLVVAAVVWVHLSRASDTRAEFTLIFIALLIGALWDSFLVWRGFLDYEHGIFHESIAPHWIIAMWALFATTLNVSLRWLKGRWFLSAVFGAIGGPLAYYAGYRLGAVEMADKTAALTALALGWAALMPFLSGLALRFNGFASSEAR